MARARLARVGKGLGWRGWAAGSALALTAAAAGPALLISGAPPAQAGIRTSTGASTAAANGTAGAPAGSGAGGACGTATGPFSVSGTQVLDGGGKPFVSYGLTVAGLQGTAWRNYTLLDLQKITATANDWCANTVRLQLDQDDLLGPAGTGFNQAYMAAIRSEVAAAERGHLVVVLNDETNLSSVPARYSELGPTPATETFWKDLAKVYGHDPQVIFDLFNEPRTYTDGMPQAQEWQLWFDGGVYAGVNYLGMAQLAAYVRTTLGTRNLFWIEGPNFSASFAGMVQQHALLHVSGVVYALHHPAGPPDTSSWDNDFGYLVTTNVAPVVVGEWTNYEPPPPAADAPAPEPSSCWANAPATVPAFLNYLALYHIGLNAYTLQPGFMIQSYSNLAGPTTMSARTWTCQSNAERQPGQGAGSDVLAWFQQQNG
jgi:Cellulase (glycosyl hydrolase family 5)